VALVTGAGSGVGWELAASLALAGLRVVAVSRRKAQLEKLQAAVLDAGVEGAEFLPVVADLSREAEVAALPRIIDKRWPGAGVDVLVNNAGGRGWRERSAGRGGGGGCVHESCQALMGGLRGLFLRPSLRGLPVC
jgi:NAD(P)-dependent dehydrogenase (short-subunit alcohol dehydrogenase family)